MKQGRHSASMTARIIGKHTSTRENKSWELWDNGLQAQPSRRYSVATNEGGTEVQNISFREESEARKVFDRKIETYYERLHGVVILAEHQISNKNKKNREEIAKCFQGL